ncbi:MAG: glycoside hydrolase family 43 protein [Clostridia bacterium]|nr:glycoside hydrolase family 43 protein [Clostridia bacterium]
MVKKSFINPIIPHTEIKNTGDPFVVRHGGAYYHCYADWDGVYITKSPTLWDIGKHQPKKIYDYNKEGALSRWYAPELHYVDGAWYVYGSPDYGNDNHVMSALCCRGDDPLGEYEFKGQIRGLENQWTIDGTVFYYKDVWWFSWTNCSQLFLAKMDGPLAIQGDVLILTTPEYAFEKQGSPVNEGSAAIVRNGKLFIVYSASDSKSDGYCLGLLEFIGENAEDMLKKDKWRKTPYAVFEQTDGVYGPGHCSFTKVEKDGVDEDYIVYHANLVSGSGWNGRSVWAQKFAFNEEGKPVFGIPQKECII